MANIFRLRATYRSGGQSIYGVNAPAENVRESVCPDSRTLMIGNERPE